MGDQHSWSGCFGEQRYPLFLLQTEPWQLSCPACSLVTTLTTVSQLIMHCHTTFVWLSKHSERRESFGNKCHDVCHYWTVCTSVVINKAPTRSLRKYSISSCSKYRSQRRDVTKIYLYFHISFRRFSNCYKI